MDSTALVPLQTTRLRLRDFTPDDAVALHAMRSDPEVTRFMDFGPETPEQSRAWLATAMADAQVSPHAADRLRRAYNLAIVRRSDDQVIGWIGIGDSERHPGPGELGFGYMLRPSAWGQGYATEAVHAILDLGFDGLGGRRVSAWCRAANVASARVLVKAGLRLERRYQDRDPKTGRPMDCLEFALRADERRGPAVG